MDTKEPKHDDRQIRVFISSTFRDMQAERDYLVKTIFPQLRKLCESRAVTWTEVDLRWGITETESSEGRVLPLCLAEIERCRPYFISMLGQRYGWVPENYPENLTQDQPWLKEHLHHSVTELEIIHGVLQSPKMLDRSLFYFRDPKYLDLVPDEKKADFTAENADHAAKLSRLKQRIRDEHTKGLLKFAPRENYPTPEALGEMILTDFTQIIDSLYPADQIPDPLDQEAARHEAYARSRRMAFVGREDLLKRMTDYVAAGGKPLVLTGDSGCGKSALLAEWLARWRKDHPEDLVIQHYIGSTPDSADWQGLVRRILGELKRAYNIPDQLPMKADELRTALNDWLAKAAGRRRIILVLDALNQLTDADAAHQLGWLPVVFPPNVRVLVSSLAGDTLEAVHRRQWQELNVPLFGKANIAPAAKAYFNIFAKTPDDRMIQALEAAPAATNALYLRAVMDELRQFGEHKELPQRTAWYLAATDLPSLFDRILTRWHDDFGKDKNHPDLVRRSLCLIACSRFGLAESELLDLLGKKNEQGNDEPLPRRPWTLLYLAAENSLSIRAGLLNFGHDYLRTAVRKRWLADEQVVGQFRTHLTDYFEKQAIGLRQAGELPWLLQQADERDRLRDCLLNIDRFLVMQKSNENELLGYWVWLGQEQQMGKFYLESFYQWETAKSKDTTVSYTANELGQFLHSAAQYAEAEPLIKRALAIDEASFGKDHPDVAIRLNNLAVLYQDTNRPAEAEPLYKRALAIDEASFGKDHPDVARDLNNLAQLYQNTNRLTQAEPLMKRALTIWEKSLGKDHPNVATALNNLARLYHATNRLAEAEILYKRALTIWEKSLGKDHPNIAAALNNLARLNQATNRLSEAEPLFKRSLAIDEASFGKDHPGVARDLNNLAILYEDMNRLAEAEILYKRALTIWEKSLGKDHPNVATALNNLAQVYKVTNRQAQAELLFKRSLAIDEASFGKDHTNVAIRASNLATLYHATNRFAEAELLIKRALAIDEASLGKDHPDVALDLNILAQIYQDTNRLTQAEMLMKRVVKIFEKSLGKDHPNIATVLNNLAQLYQATNRLSEAEPLMKRALAIDEASFGKDHPNVAIQLNNLAELYQATNRLAQAELMMKRALLVFLSSLGFQHPNTTMVLNNYTRLLMQMGFSQEQIKSKLNEILRPFGMSQGG